MTREFPVNARCIIIQMRGKIREIGLRVVDLHKILDRLVYHMSRLVQSALRERVTKLTEILFYRYVDVDTLQMFMGTLYADSMQN